MGVRVTMRSLAVAVWVASMVRAGSPAAPGTPFEGWRFLTGSWEVDGQCLVQKSLGADCRAFAPAAKWRDYVLEVKARKLRGAEGFLVLFRVQDSRHFYWWNIAGWGNTRHAVETRPRRVFPSVPGRVETGRWYDIRVVAQGERIRCYLDGKLIHDIRDKTYLWGGVGLGSWMTSVEYKDLGVRTLDGQKLFGLSSRELVERLMEVLGPAAASLGPQAEALKRAGAPPDDPRWGALYRKASAIQEKVARARGALEGLDLDKAADALRRIVRVCPREAAKARALLARLERQRGPIEAARRRLASGTQPNLAFLEEALALADEIADLRRATFARRCPPVAFIKRPANGRRGTNATMLARMTATGSGIWLFEPAHPERGAKTIFNDPEGFIFDMSPSYDGKRLVFAYKRKVRERKDSFHIWEIRTDGTGLRQITKGRYHDVSPVYLPDGRIVFVSTRVEAFSMCQDFLAAALYVVNPDGTGLRRLEYNTLCDTSPAVLDDGSILFTRWEYQDKNIFCVQGLWTINPDGSRLQLFYGNTLTIPNSIYGARQIPGTKKVICTMAAHHHPPLGAIAIIDRTLGLENPEAMKVLTPEIPYRPRLGPAWNYGANNTWGPGDRFFPWSYGDPWPVAEDLFLVAYGGPPEGGPRRYRIYLMDERGEKVCLYEDPKTSCFNPVGLAPRPLPRRFPGQPPQEPKGEGTYLVLDIYRGLREAGVQRGQVKALRIMSQVPKKYNTEGPRYRDHYPAIGHGTYYVKYCYGTVPVSEDGTAYFRAPAGVELYFQALDAEGREVRRMGTVTQITDGEVQTCIGCHEPRNATPPNDYRPSPVPRRQPDRITPPPWGEGTIDFVRLVQPVLDRHCVRCHGGEKTEADLDLSGDKTRFFNMAFETLTDRRLVTFYWIHDAPTGNFPPLASGSYVSKLTKLLMSDHHGVTALIRWADATPGIVSSEVASSRSRGSGSSRGSSASTAPTATADASEGSRRSATAGSTSRDRRAAASSLHI